MSKLHTQYLALKKANQNKIYLFKSGIFYIALDSDAYKLADIFNFKTTNLNSDIVKVGFPQNRLNYYSEELNKLNVPFEIIDSNYSKIDNYADYLNNEKLKEITKSILDLDFNNLTFKDAFYKLLDIQNEIKNII